MKELGKEAGATKVGRRCNTFTTTQFTIYTQEKMRSVRQSLASKQSQIHKIQMVCTSHRGSRVREY